MKIPKQAKPVFTGEIFTVYQWPQKLFDGSSATFEMIWRIGCTDVIATLENKIIILKQKQPGRDWYFSLPWGRLEKWETPLKWAKRELLEETWCSSKNWQKFQSWNSAPKVDFEETLFVARDCTMTSLPDTDAGEKIMMQLVSFTEFLDIARSPNFWITPSFKYCIYECLLDKKLQSEFKKFIFWK